MPRKKSRDESFRDIAVESASRVLKIPWRELTCEPLDPKGLFWVHLNGKGAIALFFRPTGITYEDRPQTLEKLKLKQIKGVHLHYRFSLERRRMGPGAGGLEVFSHRVRENHKPSTRLNLLVTEAWDILHVGKEIGSVGWFPREVSTIFRPLFPHYPYAFTHYSLNPTPKSAYERRPNLFLCFVMWNLNSDKMEFHKQDLIRAYGQVYERSSLQLWDTAILDDAWVIPHGYGGEIVVE